MILKRLFMSGTSALILLFLSTSKNHFFTVDRRTVTLLTPTMCSHLLGVVVLIFTHLGLVNTRNILTKYACLKSIKEGKK